MKKIGVMVVHGIGDPQPGEALTNLTNSIATETSLLAGLSPPVAKQLPEPDHRRPNLIRYFPMYTRRGRSVSGNTLIFAEVYWGTATQLKLGWLGVLQGLARLFFSISHVVEGAVSPELKQIPQTLSERLKYYLLKLLNLTARMTSLVMSGPVLALNLLLLIGLLPYSAIRFLAPTGSAIRWGWLVPVVVALVSIAIGVWIIRNSSERDGHGAGRPLPRSWPQFSLGVSIMILAGIWLAFVLLTAPATWLELVELPALLLRHAFATVLLLLFILISFIVLIELTGSKRNELTAAALAVSVQYFLWVLLVPAFWRFLLLSGDEVDPLSEQVYELAVFGDGLQWVGAAFLLVVIGLAVTEYSLRARRLARRNRKTQAAEETEETQEAQKKLRFIIHPWIRYLLIGMNWFGASALLVAYYAPTISPWVTESVAMTIDWLEATGITAGGATLIIYVAPLLVAALRLGLDLANDVMTYIYWNCNAQRRRENRQREQIGSTEAEAAFSSELSRRRPVRSRFYAVANHLLKERKVDQLVIIAHSQGTVIAIDELAHSFSKERFENVPVVLVTMGSPISHLYQHYFPTTYPGWQDTQWDELFRRVKRWLNLYRVNDVVGTMIDPPTRSGNGAVRLEQAAIGPGGHTNYWTDKRMLGHLGDFKPFE